MVNGFRWAYKTVKWQYGLDYCFVIDIQKGLFAVHAARKPSKSTTFIKQKL
jgi:hypothetical protein